MIETPKNQQKVVQEAVPSQELPPKPSAQLPPTPMPAVRTKLGKLGDLRQQVADKQKLASLEEVRPLTDASLKMIWEEYTNELRNLKNPAVQSFELAKLKLLSESEFEVICGTGLEQKFIEQERSQLSEHTIKHLNNRQILYSILVEEKIETDEPVERPLNTKEQFLKIAEEYPLVKELRDRLKLDLDF